MTSSYAPARVAAVVPCFRVLAHIDGVIGGLTPFVDHVFVVDDACPEQTGAAVCARHDPAFVTVLRHATNQGVGGAVVTGYRAAARAGYDVIVKVDGDGQMDPRFIPALVAPILARHADYTKGNRFFDLRGLETMPTLRKLGNAALSFVSKAASGYWDTMDPTNGFTAIHCAVLRWLPLERIERRYFFESDMLFRLGCARAVVHDVPMPARYGEEVSNLRIGRVLFEFPGKYLARLGKRLFYSYFLRGFNAGTVLLCSGTVGLTFGLAYGTYHWWWGSVAGAASPPGVVMLAALPTILGVQFLLGFLQVDVASVPRRVIWPDSAQLPLNAPADRPG